MIPLAQCGYSTSIIYQKFNTETAYTEDLDKNYTTVSASILNKLTYNDTSTQAKVQLRDMQATGDKWLEFIMYDNNAVDVVYQIGDDPVKIADGTWSNTTAIDVTIRSNKLEVAIGETILIQGFSINITIGQLGALGSSTTVALGGYVQIDVNVSGSGIDMSEWMPTIIGLAMMTVVLGFVKKIGQ